MLLLLLVVALDSCLAQDSDGAKRLNVLDRSSWEHLDYYALLEVDVKVSSSDLKKAYRTVAVKYHPDKWSSADERVAAEQLFVRIVQGT